MGFLYEVLIYFIYFGIPAAAVIWFVISLILFLRTDKSNPKRQTRKILVIVSACVAGFLVAALILLMILVMFDISHM